MQRGGTMGKSASVLVRIALLIPAVVLGVAALSRVPSALAVEAAFPVPDYLAMNYPLPQEAYAQAEVILGAANAEDGETHIYQAHAAISAGKPPIESAPIVESALSHAPGSPLGWTLLAETQAANDQRRAARSLAIAFDLSPFDYFLAARQAKIASLLWPILSEETKSEAIARVRLLWSEPNLRVDMLNVAVSEHGAELTGTVFADEPEQLRAFNRWFASELRRLVGPP